MARATGVSESRENLHGLTSGEISNDKQFVEKLEDVVLNPPVATR